MVRRRIKFSAFENVVCDECKNCQKRSEDCHSSCEDYLKAQLTIELLRADLLKELAIKNGTQSYMIDRSFAKAKHKHPSTRYGKNGKRR